MAEGLRNLPRGTTFDPAVSYDLNALIRRPEFIGAISAIAAVGGVVSAAREWSLSDPTQAVQVIRVLAIVWTAFFAILAVVMFARRGRLIRFGKLNTAGLFSALIIGSVCVGLADPALARPYVLGLVLVSVCSGLALRRSFSLPLTALAMVGVGLIDHGAGAPTYVIGFDICMVACGWFSGYLGHHAHKIAAKALATLSRTDSLTGLPNRRGWVEEAEERIAFASNSGRRTALILLDLDGFKSVNDVEGHAAGDELLIWVSDQLRETLRGGDVAGRLGGDEFAVMLDGLPASSLKPLLERVAEMLGERIGASVGMAVLPDDGTALDTLLKRADETMFADKRQRKEPQREAS